MGHHRSPGPGHPCEGAASPSSTLLHRRYRFSGDRGRGLPDLRCRDDHGIVMPVTAGDRDLKDGFPFLLDLIRHYPRDEVERDLPHCGDRGDRGDYIALFRRHGPPR